MTIFFGTLLSLTRMTLEPRQKKQEEIDTKKKILGAVVNVSEYEPEEILSIYNERMESMVINYENEIVENDSKGNKIIAENINIQKNCLNCSVKYIRAKHEKNIYSAIIY